MRAVNLVPRDYRRGVLAGKGGETFSYMLLGGLAVVLVAVLAVVLTNNSIADNKAKVATLKQQEIDTQSKADALQPYAQFASLEQTRTLTVSSLAQSRFDWERVLRELAVIIPADVEMQGLKGTVTPDVTLDNSPDIELRTNVPGPALELIGCAPGQDQVATFATAIEDIDGVTRVGVSSSGSGNQPTAQDATTSASASPDQCKQGQDRFEIVAAFDAAPIPPSSANGAVPVLPAPAAPAPSAPNGSGSNRAQEQQASQEQSVKAAKNKVDKATKLIPGN